MTDADIDEAIETLTRACNVENRWNVIQTLRKMVNSGGEFAPVSADAKPVAWVRYRSDGGFEGPIMDTDARMCDTRRSFWTPLVHATPAQSIADTAGAKAVAWKVVWPNGIYDLFAYEQDAVADAEIHRGTIIPLYASPAIDAAQDDSSIDDCIQELMDAKTLGEKFSARNQLDLAIKRKIESAPAIDADAYGKGYSAGKAFAQRHAIDAAQEALFNACMVREISPSGTPKEVLDRIIDWEVDVNKAPAIDAVKPVSEDDIRDLYELAKMCKFDPFAEGLRKLMSTRKAPELSTLFRDAIAWGRAYGNEIPASQWDGMREAKVTQLTSSIPAIDAAGASEGDVRDALMHLFREAMSFGLVYGPVYPSNWDKLREEKVKQLVDRAFAKENGDE